MVDQTKQNAPSGTQIGLQRIEAHLERCRAYLLRAESPNVLNWLQTQITLFQQITHGHWPQWLNIIGQLPEPDPLAQVDLDLDAISVVGRVPLSPDELESLLMGFSPWRKGPYALYGISIDTEWQSQLKWDRLKDALTPLHGRHVLDVGTGSGYHLWRMLGAGATSAVGVEPTVAFVAQFYAVAHLINEPRAVLIPATLEQIDRPSIFDTVFSMGVLYHRRDPLGHLRELAECLRPGGELVLETLVIDGNEQQVLTPHDRYAAMRNVWFIPSVPLLMIWLKRLGYINIRLIHQEWTSLEEQRATRWTDYRQSLADFLNPDDRRQTMEGYPAPQRAILLANRP